MQASTVWALLTDAGWSPNELESLTKIPNEIKGKKILVVGESGGEVEAMQQAPFVGPTGNLLNGLLTFADLDRSQVDVANVCQFHPSKNALDPWAKFEDWRYMWGQEELRELLEKGEYQYILPLGKYACQEVLGYDDIMNRRGSVYKEHGAWVIPTLHPAFLFQQPKAANPVIRDFLRFGHIIRQGGWDQVIRNLILFPRDDQIEAFVKRAEQAEWIACDVEADADDPKREMTEIGFALSTTDAIVFPYNKGEYRRVVEYLLSLPNRKVFHNAAFDVVYLDYIQGIKVDGVVEDTMLMHHTINPELPHSLAFCVSLYTNEPYFKDLGKKRGNSEGTDEQFQYYNAMDVACTAELFPIFRERLKHYKLNKVYNRKRRVLPYAIGMSLKGVNYDHEKATEIRERIRRFREKWQMILDLRIVRWQAKHALNLDMSSLTNSINVGSTPQSKALLYGLPKCGGLGLPPQKVWDKKAGKEKITTGQKKLLTLYPTIQSRELRKILRAFLKVRQHRKLLEVEMKPSLDGRMRTGFNCVGAETGRWSASRFLIDLEGGNLQTLTTMWKPAFVADPGKVLAYCDYSQIEARFVAFDAEDAVQLKALDDPKGDLHRLNAARILGKDKKDVTRTERNVVGKSSHSLNYDVGGATLADFINRKGLDTNIWVTVEYTTHVRELYRSKYHTILRWQDYWPAVAKANNRRLENYLGRERIFLGPMTGPKAHETRGEIIAFRPQSSVPDLLDIAICRIARDTLCREHGVDLLLQVHDAILVQGNVDTVEIWLPRVLTLMTIPIKIHGRTCVVPTDAGLNYCWKDMMSLEKFLKLRDGGA